MSLEVEDQTHLQAFLACCPVLPGTTPSQPLSLPGAPCLIACWNSTLSSAPVHGLGLALVGVVPVEESFEDDPFFGDIASSCAAKKLEANSCADLTGKVWT